MLIYVAGPYRAKGDRTVEQNVAQAAAIALELWKAGHVAICPHLNTSFGQESGLSEDVFIEGDMAIVARCDGMVLTPDWSDSVGAVRECEYANRLNIPVWVYPALPSQHPTEARSPIQCKAFLETVMTMYRVHLDKNADYSPANILGTGEMGTAVRAYDKVVRLMSLTGFRIAIDKASFMPRVEEKPEESVTLARLWFKVTWILSSLGFRASGSAIATPATKPKNEAVDDTYLDLANYAIIGRLLRSGQWGK